MLFAILDQMVERMVLNHVGVGSTPTDGTVKLVEKAKTLPVSYGNIISAIHMHNLVE